MNANSESAQPSDMVADEALLLLLGEGWCWAITVRLSGAEDLVNQLQDGVSYGYQRGVLFTTGFGGQTPELLL